MAQLDSNARYLHWDELRFRTPPTDVTHEEWWLALKLQRKGGYRSIPLKDKSGQQFRFCVPDIVADLLHQIDRGGGTSVQIPEQITNADQRNRYVMRSLMEEAIYFKSVGRGRNDARGCEKNACGG